MQHMHACENPAMDTESQQLLDQVNSQNVPPLESMPIDQLRKYISSFSYPSTIELSKIENLNVPVENGTIPIRIYTPLGDGPFPVLAFFHGGGWVFGTLDGYDPFCRELALKSGFMVVSVDYRLAPENKFPRPLFDCYQALVWTFQNISTYNGNPCFITVCGDSAGGNLAASVALIAKERKGPSLAGQILIYPVLDYNFETDSYKKYAQHYFLTASSMIWFWNQYLPSPNEGANPLASPLRGNIQGLPPTFLLLAHFDPLHDEGCAYAQKLKEGGIPVCLKTYPTIHAFVSFAHILNIGHEAIDDVAKYLKNLNESNCQNF